MAKNKLGVVDGAGEAMDAGTSLNTPLPSPLPQAGEGTKEEGAQIVDEFHGQGGSYVVDAVTQTRVQNK